MFDIGDDEVTRPVNRPLCLAIACPDELALRWGICANSAGMIMRTVSLESARTLVRAWRPMAILVTNDVYAFDPAGMLRMAHEVGAQLIRLSVGSRQSDQEEERLQSDLGAVLLSQRTATTRPALVHSTVEPRPARRPLEEPKKSGIRLRLPALGAPSATKIPRSA